MFGLLHNLFKYVKVSRERRITFVVLGLDAAGKTTLLNTLKGELGKEVAPTFGFKTEEMGEGKYTVVFFDLGGSSSMRKTWRSYLAEVHAVVFVVDAAAPARFAEAATTLSGLLENRQMKGKPLLVFANKQDLPTAASPADIAAALGLANHKQNKFHILACTALSSVDTDPDPRLRMGMRWLVASVDTLYGVLAPRVAADTAVVRAEEAKKKAERAERARVTREERQQAQRAEEAAAAAAAAGGSAACESAAAPPRPLPLDLTVSLQFPQGWGSRLCPMQQAAGGVGGGPSGACTSSRSNPKQLATAPMTLSGGFSELMGAPGSSPIPNQIESPKPAGGQHHPQATRTQREAVPCLSGLGSQLSGGATGGGAALGGMGDGRRECGSGRVGGGAGVSGASESAWEQSPGEPPVGGGELLLLYGGIRPHSGKVVPLSRRASRDGAAAAPGPQ
ncbi:MAG: hypothetical protein WDW36_003799 [Sanguina aurantia]